MAEQISDVKRGDLFRWVQLDVPDRPVYIAVTRVAKDGSWADVRCYTWAVAWTKRQRLPLPEGTERYAWTTADLDRDAKAAIRAGGES